jgi:hypothetical protein
MLHLMFLIMYFLFFITNVIFKHCICDQFLDLMRIHLFYCAHCKRKICEEKNNFPWCYVRCFCVYYKECKISRFMWVYPYFLVICLCLYINGSTCAFNRWWMLFDVIIAKPTCTYLVLQATLSHGVKVIIVT